MKITEDVRKYAAEQGVSEQEALIKGPKAGSPAFYIIFLSHWGEDIHQFAGPNTVSLKRGFDSLHPLHSLSRTCEAVQ